jgi:uncharacterized protein YceH (UPF0502 family)
MQRIEVNCETGEQIIVDLTAEEVEQALAQKAAWDAAQAQIQVEPTLEQQLAELRAELAALKGTQA